MNDVHSQLNPTTVAAILTPATEDEVCDAVLAAGATGDAICIAGGRHAMGGQQFADRATLLDMSCLSQVVGFDPDRGLVTAGAGIQWPELLAFLEAAQQRSTRRWSIAQKQTGADRLSLGGALACNAHGRGLTLPPIVDQVESFDIVCADSTLRHCSRTSNPDLFRLAIGGYGLFGVMTRVQLRLVPRVKVERVVEVRETDGLAEAFEQRIADGYLYGDFQFSIDDRAASFLRRGVFSCYQPVPDARAVTANRAAFGADDWSKLIYLAHYDKARAFDEYAAGYLRTSGQVYWSDDQLAPEYLDDYHHRLDCATGAPVKATEMIGEVYVPRHALATFMCDAGRALRHCRANVIYGTVRMIEPDRETFLAWARERYACIVFNLHVEHTPDGIASAAEAFRALIDLAIAQHGSYYLTYHRWARPDQVLACYPQIQEFLRLKRAFDPNELFQSNWYRSYRRVFAGDVEKCA